MKKDINNYQNNIVKKPWGYEYLAYQNDSVALWVLFIAPNNSTSFHCHPNKTTGLMLLEGEVNVSFFNNNFMISSGNKIMIRKGLFHSTKCVNETGSIVFEIETPVDKQDLVRFKDDYGREGKPYEDQTHEKIKTLDCIWIKDPIGDESDTYTISNSKLIVKKINDIEYFENFKDEENIMFLKGGIKTDYGQYVAGPGDIVSVLVLKRLTQLFEKLDEQTIILKISK